MLGCLIEKQRTTPDQYPLSLNGLRSACNQSTNRAPVVEYDEPTIRAALERLSRKGWTRLASSRGTRAVKYRHLFDEALRLSGEELALLCVLMLRGPQTAGELKQRSERLNRFGSLDEIEQVLTVLAERELVLRLPRRPGQKEQRYAHLLEGEGPQALPSEPERQVDATTPAAPAGAAGLDAERLAAIEREVHELRDELMSLRADLASLREQLGASPDVDAG